MRIGKSANIEVLDESISVTDLLASLDFVGAGVTVSEAAEGVLTVTIPSGGAGTGTGWSGTVANVASLPAAADNNGNVYRVTTSTGLFWAQRKGFYGSNGTVWTRESDPTFTVLDDEMTIYDDADNTKGLQFQVSPVGTGQIRVFSPVDADMNWSEVVANTAKVTNANHSGDATGATALTIANDAVTYAKIQNVVADLRLLGNIAGAGQPVAELTATQIRTLINVEDGSTADQSDAEIKTAYENNANTNAFTDADESKLDGIEALADVTDATNVNSAGAVMEADYNANSILAATSDDTPAVLTVAEQTLVGRITAGGIDSLTIAEIVLLLFHTGTTAPTDTTRFWIDTN